MNNHQTNKRLFMLRWSDGKLVRNEQTGEPLYFPSKSDAKRERHDGSHVTPGPDHYKAKGGAQ